MVKSKKIINKSKKIDDPIPYASKEEEEDFLNFSDDEKSDLNTNSDIEEDTFGHVQKACDVVMSDDESENESDVDENMSKSSEAEYQEIEEYDSDQPTDRKSSRELGKLYAEKNKRTLFVGNITTKVTKKVLQQLFNSKRGAGEGSVETVRIRGAIGDDKYVNARTKRKAVIMKSFADENQVLCAFVVLKKEEDVGKCLSLNGHVLDGKHIRVDKIKGKKMNFIPGNCIFIGNLPYTINEEMVRENFEKCGEIINIRLVRNKTDGKLIGIGYVEFTDSLSVDFALKLNGTLSIEDRSIRIQKWTEGKTQKERRKVKTENKKSIKSSKVVAPSNLKGVELKEYILSKKKKNIKKAAKMNNFVKSKQKKSVKDK